MKITNRLSQLRCQAGKTQEQVIEEITALLGRQPFTRQALSHWETGRNPIPDRELAQLCTYYEVTPGDILVLQAESGRELAVA